MPACSSHPQCINRNALVRLQHVTSSTYCPEPYRGSSSSIPTFLSADEWEPWRQQNMVLPCTDSHMQKKAGKPAGPGEICTCSQITQPCVTLWCFMPDTLGNSKPCTSPYAGQAELDCLQCTWHCNTYTCPSLLQPICWAGLLYADWTGILSKQRAFCWASFSGESCSLTALLPHGLSEVSVPEQEVLLWDPSK